MKDFLKQLFSLQTLAKLLDAKARLDIVSRGACVHCTFEMKHPYGSTCRQAMWDDFFNALLGTSGKE